MATLRDFKNDLGIKKIKSKSVQTLYWWEERGNGREPDWNRVNGFVFAIAKVKGWNEICNMEAGRFNALVTQFEQIAKEKKEGRESKYVKELLAELKIS